MPSPTRLTILIILVVSATILSLYAQVSSVFTSSSAGSLTTDSPTARASTLAREICPGPGQWSDDLTTWEPEGSYSSDQSAAAALSLSSSLLRTLPPNTQQAPPRPAQCPRTVFQGEETRMWSKKWGLARVLFIGDSTMIRLWGQSCGGWGGTYTNMYEEDLDTSKVNGTLGWRDYLRVEKPVPRLIVMSPEGFRGTFEGGREGHGEGRDRGHTDGNRTDVDLAAGLPDRIRNPMGNGVASNRRLCPDQGLDIEIIPLPMCSMMDWSVALAAHRDIGSYDYIVVNCGLWEAKEINTAKTASEMAHLVRKHLSLLAPLARRALVWVTTSATLDLKTFPQRTAQIARDTAATLRMIAEEGALQTRQVRGQAGQAGQRSGERGQAAENKQRSPLGRVVVLDAFKMSQRRDMHLDNVHMSRNYYAQLNAMLTRFVQVDYIAGRAWADALKLGK